MAKKSQDLVVDAVAGDVSSKRPWFKKKRFIIPIAAVVLLIAISSAGRGSGKSTDAESQASNTETQSATSTTPSAEKPSTTPSAQKPDVPAEYLAALAQANTYANTMHMCKAKLYDQLTSEYGGQFAPEPAQYAVDNVKTDWNANALALAKRYQSSMNMSSARIHDQLTSDFGEKCTQENADYAISNLG